MVALILTRAGFEDMRPRIDVGRDAIWVNAGVLSASEIAKLRELGCDLSVFTNPLDLSDLASDIDTVVEHHPNEVLWVETLAR